MVTRPMQQLKSFIKLVCTSLRHNRCATYITFMPLPRSDCKRPLDPFDEDTDAPKEIYIEQTRKKLRRIYKALDGSGHDLCPDQWFQVPTRWTCSEADRPVDIIKHIWWYFDRYDITPENDITIKWSNLASFIVECGGLRRNRRLTIHVIREKPRQGSLVRREGINVEHDLYDCRENDANSPTEYTGFDFDVQAEFLVQSRFINIIFDAIINIELRDPGFMFDFAFAGGCVKSVACAVLLASLVLSLIHI